MTMKGLCRTGLSLILILVSTAQIACQLSGSVSADVTCHPGQTTCGSQVSGRITLSQVVVSTFASAASPSAIAAYNVIWNAPTADLTLSSNSPVQTILTATTDTNYVSPRAIPFIRSPWKTPRR